MVFLSHNFLFIIIYLYLCSSQLEVLLSRRASSSIFGGVLVTIISSSCIEEGAVVAETVEKNGAGCC